jgi:hypothetical protein
MKACDCLPLGYWMLLWGVSLLIPTAWSVIYEVYKNAREAQANKGDTDIPTRKRRGRWIGSD